MAPIIQDEASHFSFGSGTIFQAELNCFAADLRLPLSISSSPASQYFFISSKMPSSISSFDIDISAPNRYNSFIMLLSYICQEFYLFFH